MLDLSGKKYLVAGVANQFSIAWPIATLLARCNAEIAFFCQERFERNVQKLAESIGMKQVVKFDVTDDTSMDRGFEELRLTGGLDGMVHSIAFSDTKQLKGRFMDVSDENFLTTMNISCLSFVKMAKKAEPLMQPGGSVITMSFDASQRTYPNYNVMGLAKAALEAAVRACAADLGEINVRVNAISPSPEKTLSARGIDHFMLIGKYCEAKSLLEPGRRATLEEIANVAVFLLSPFASGVTGQVWNVDCGASSCEMPPARHAHIMAEGMTEIVNALKEGEKA